MHAEKIVTNYSGQNCSKFREKRAAVLLKEIEIFKIRMSFVFNKFAHFPERLKFNAIWAKFFYFDSLQKNLAILKLTIIKKGLVYVVKFNFIHCCVCIICLQ